MTDQASHHGTVEIEPMIEHIPVAHDRQVGRAVLLRQVIRWSRPCGREGDRLRRAGLDPQRRAGRVPLPEI